MKFGRPSPQSLPISAKRQPNQRQDLERIDGLLPLALSQFKRFSEVAVRVDIREIV